MDDRRTTPPRRPGPAPTPATSAGPDSTTIDAVRRLEAWTAAGLAAGAGAIHLAAAPGHVEELGDLGLAFYWASLFQVGLAILLLTRPISRRTAWAGIGGSVAFTLAWAISRTVGLPSIPGGAEAIGIADGITVGLQVALVAILGGRLFRLDLRLVRARRPIAVRSLATTGLVAVLSVIVLSSTIGVRDAVAGHSHAGSGAADHQTPASMPAGMDHPMTAP
ncbi:MAG TPA: hypothetical protein VD763_05480 [Candidatus Saccharimonadales bacterium]|nr:hypothetical protein [Candidatus Saccharimonadales bacterium]